MPSFSFQGQVLKRWREQHKLTQEQAAKRFNVSRSEWNRWENGNRHPATDGHQTDLAKAVGVSKTILFVPDRAKPKRKRKRSARPKRRVYVHFNLPEDES